MIFDMCLLNRSKCKFDIFWAVAASAEILTKKCKLESNLSDVWMNLTMVRVIRKSKVSEKQFIIKKVLKNRNSNNALYILFSFTKKSFASLLTKAIIL